MKNLYWKEFREIRTVAVLCTLTCLILTFFYGMYGAFVLLIPMSLILGGDAFARERQTADFLLTKPVSRDEIITAKIVTSLAAIILTLAAAGIIILVGVWYRAQYGVPVAQDANGYQEYIPYFFSGDEKYMPGPQWTAFDLVLLAALFASSLFLSTFGLETTTALVAGAVLLGVCDLALTGFMHLGELKTHRHYSDERYNAAIMGLNVLCTFLFIWLAYLVFTKREPRR